MVNASFVFGLDGDTPETFKNTLDWIISQKIDTITSHIVTPYPGTEFYKRMEAKIEFLIMIYQNIIRLM